MYSARQSTLSTAVSLNGCLGHQSGHHGSTFHLAPSAWLASSVNKAMSGRRCSRRRRARPTAAPGPTEGVAIEVRRVDVPRRRGIRVVDESCEGITQGVMARCDEGLVNVADVVDKVTGRIRLRTMPV